jgi:4-amino-4-deoxy-L-arabinose transferase-like glycosyltransferase
MRSGGHGHHEVVSLTLQAVIAIVAFFALAFGLAVTLKAFGTAVLVIVMTTLLTVSLILQAVSESHWPPYAAIALALLTVVSRFAFEAAVLNDDRRSRRR